MSVIAAGIAEYPASHPHDAIKEVLCVATPSCVHGRRRGCRGADAKGEVVVDFKRLGVAQEAA
jgi:hypothetical protein